MFCTTFSIVERYCVWAICARALASFQYGLIGEFARHSRVFITWIEAGELEIMLPMVLCVRACYQLLLIKRTLFLVIFTPVCYVYVWLLYCLFVLKCYANVVRCFSVFCLYRYRFGCRLIRGECVIWILLCGHAVWWYFSVRGLVWISAWSCSFMRVALVIVTLMPLLFYLFMFFRDSL